MKYISTKGHRNNVKWLHLSKTMLGTSLLEILSIGK